MRNMRIIIIVATQFGIPLMLVVKNREKSRDGFS